jgi:hypothetical protein
VLINGYSVWFRTRVGQWLYFVDFEQCFSVVILCVLGTVLVSCYIVWFLNSVCQCLYCVVSEQCWSVVLLCGF